MKVFRPVIKLNLEQVMDYLEKYATDVSPSEVSKADVERVRRISEIMRMRLEESILLTHVQKQKKGQGR